MKLRSLYFAAPAPVPGTPRRESSLHASDGWELERHEGGLIRCVRVEPVDGGTVRRDFVLDGWPVAYEVAPEPELAPESVPVPVPAELESPRRRRGR